jgi:hypothetical protein
VQSPGAATFFATIIITGAGTATNCRIEQVTPAGGAVFTYQTTNPATNQLTGTPNTPVNIPGGGFQTFFMAFASKGAFGPADVTLAFVCDNTAPAQLITGVNAPTLGVSASPGPDIVALAAADAGIVNLVGNSLALAATEASAGAFAVATVNVGAGGQITASADDGGAGLPIGLSLCQTNPATGACITGQLPSVAVTINSGETPTFAIFVTSNSVVPFDPARNRVFVRFRDGAGVLRGATSVAVRSL